MKKKSKLVLFLGLSFYAPALFSDELMDDPSSYESAVDAINKEHDQKRRAIHDDYNEKIRALDEARQRQRDSLSGKTSAPKWNPEKSAPVALKDGPAIQEHFDKKAEELLRQKQKNLKEAKFQQDDALREALLDKIDKTMDTKKRGQEIPKGRTAPTTERAKTIVALQEHEKAEAALKRGYDQSFSALQRRHQDKIRHLEGLRNNESTFIKTDDGKELKGEDKVYEYYTSHIDALNAEYEKEKAERLADYKKNLSDLTAKTNDALDKASGEKKDALLSTELKSVTPRNIDDFVDQFSDKVVSNLSPTQKDNLREIVSTVRQEIVNGTSLDAVIQRNKADFIEKLNLDSAQLQTLHNFTDKPQREKSLFDMLLEFLKGLFSGKSTKKESVESGASQG